MRSISSVKRRKRKMNEILLILLTIFSNSQTGSHICNRSLFSKKFQTKFFTQSKGMHIMGESSRIEQSKNRSNQRMKFFLFNKLPKLTESKISMKLPIIETIRWIAIVFVKVSSFRNNSIKEGGVPESYLSPNRLVT